MSLAPKPSASHQVLNIQLCLRSRHVTLSPLHPPTPAHSPLNRYSYLVPSFQASWGLDACPAKCPGPPRGLSLISFGNKSCHKVFLAVLGWVPLYMIDATRPQGAPQVREGNRQAGCQQEALWVFREGRSVAGYEPSPLLLPCIPHPTS